MSDRLQIVALIDALGWEYVRERTFLDDVLPYRTPLQTVLGFSSGAIPTILTGLMPERHGHWNPFYYDPKHAPFWWLKGFNWLPKKVLDKSLRPQDHQGTRSSCLWPGTDLRVLRFSLLAALLQFLRAPRHLRSQGN